MCCVRDSYIFWSLFLDLYYESKNFSSKYDPYAMLYHCEAWQPKIIFLWSKIKGICSVAYVTKLLNMILHFKGEIWSAKLPSNYLFIAYITRWYTGEFLVKIRQVYFFWQGWRPNFFITLFQDLMRPSRYYCNFKAKKWPFFC